MECKQTFTRKDNKIDIDKFICGLARKLSDKKKAGRGPEGLRISDLYQLLTELLAEQDVIYKDGSLIKIGSKKCDGKLKDMLDKKVLANSCEISNDEHEIRSALRIEKGK